MRRWLFPCLFLVSFVSSQAQTSVTDLGARLVHQPLFLRGLWQDNKLHFDSAGKLLGASGTTSPMLSGIDVDTVEWKGDRLLSSGKREGILFVDKKSQRVHVDGTIHVTIDASPTSDVTAAVTSVFAPDFAGMAPAAPEIWHHFLTGVPDEKANDVHKVVGGPTPPRVLHAPEPKYGEEALKLKVNGVSLVYLHVEADDSISNVRILNPAVVGLDEKAVQAVKGYRFAPARENGHGVTVEMEIEVYFRTK